MEGSASDEAQKARHQSAEKSYEMIMGALNDWTPSNLGTYGTSTTPGGYSAYDMDLEDDDEDNEEQDDHDLLDSWMSTSNSNSSRHRTFSDLAGTTTPQRQQQQQQQPRSTVHGTPKIRNSGQKQLRDPTPLELSEDLPVTEDVDMDDDDMALGGGVDGAGIESPWVSRSPTRGAGSGLGRTSNGSSNHNEAHDYRRYYETLFTYLVARRNLSERVRIREEEAQLALVDPKEQINLTKEETRVEMDFVGALSSLCLDRPTEKDMNEGNFWNLLAALRSLGMKSLLSDDGVSQKFQQQNEIEALLQELSQKTDKAPADLLEALESNDTPLALRRRRVLLQWMEQCQEILLSDIPMPAKKQTTMWPASLSRVQQGQYQRDKIQSCHPDAPLLVQDGKNSTSVNAFSPLFGDDEEADAILLQSCLALMLSGRLDQAMELCRQCGQSWRAAAWGGGSPQGTVSAPNRDTQLMEKVMVGNPHRALWKRQCWNLSQKLAQQQTAVGTSAQYEGAIYAFLAGDTTNALANPAFGSWERSLQVVLHSSLGRIEDDLYYRHNHNRRLIGKRLPFAGTDLEVQEREQLQATMALQNMTEVDLCGKLSSRIESSDRLRTAMEAFMIGKSAVSQYIANEGGLLDTSGSSALDVAHLRFLTHLTLYIDSLSASATTAASLPGVEMVKNTILLKYVQHLATRPDLWRMIALYASLLPKETLLECYPTLLTRVNSDAERRGMLKDARDLFPPGLDLVILRRVVRILLSDQDDSNRADVRKMKAILWLCYYNEHASDALICANSLLRQFLLEDKLNSACVFADKFLPDDIAATVVTQTQQQNAGNDMANDDEDGEIIGPSSDDSLAEHGALQSYLQAEKAYENWSQVLRNTSPHATNVPTFQSENLNATESQIAESMERKEMIRIKRRAGQAVVEAATAAREKLSQVLAYPGGFLGLAEEDKDPSGSDAMQTEEGAQRQEQLVALRRRRLPRAVFLLQDVCDATADWMARFLHDAIPSIAKTQLAVLSALDSVDELETSPLSPIYWLEHALSLTEIVASDEYEVYKSFEVVETKRFVAAVAETEVKKLRYSVEIAE